MDGHVLLFVEDDPLVAMLFTDAFEQCGHDVRVCATAYDALNYLDMESNVDCLITDVMLSDGTNGWELARCVRERLPELPVFYVTGKSGDDFPAETVPGGVLIRKPVVATAVAELVSEQLRSDSPAATIEPRAWAAASGGPGSIARSQTKE